MHTVVVLFHTVYVETIEGRLYINFTQRWNRQQDDSSTPSIALMTVDLSLPTGTSQIP